MLMSNVHTANASAGAGAAAADGDGEESNSRFYSMKNVLKSKADATLTYVENCHFDRNESAVNNFFYASHNLSTECVCKTEPTHTHTHTPAQNH